MNTARQFRHFFLITIILLSYSMLSAQVRIKERVEIDPSKASVSDGPQISKDFSVDTPGPLNPNDFALDGGGGFIESYDYIYNDRIFVPRVGGIVGIAYDYWYLLGGASSPWDNRLYVFGPSGDTNQVFNFSDFIDVSSGEFKWNEYAFSQEKYEEDKENAEYWAARDSSYIPHPEMWGYYPVTRMFLSVKAWEPLRFRYYYYKDSDEGTFASPITSIPAYDLFTDYPSPYGTGAGRLLFPSLAADPGEVFNIKWVSRDSSAIGNMPIIYSDETEFYLPDSGMYRVIIGNVLPHVNGTLSVIDTMPHVLVNDIRSRQGDTVLIGPYAEETVLQFDIDGMGQSGGQGEYASGGIGFESWIDYDFQDAAIWFEYAAQPVDHLELWSTTETIYYGDTLDIEVVPCGSDSLFSPLGADYNYEFSIELTGETSNYVELIYEDEASNYLEHIYSYDRRGVDVRLAANKEEPDSVVALTFHLKAKYIGQGGMASSIREAPDNQTGVKVLTKQSNINENNAIVSNKDGKVTINIGTEKKTFEKIGAKKLQALYSGKRRKIGHPVNVKSRNNIPSASLSKKKILASTMNGETETVEVENDWFIGESKHEILLGETKYFKARKNPDPKYPYNIIIEEVTTFNNDTGEPLNDGADDVKFDVAQQPETGVYWESKWPHWIDKTIDGNAYKIAEMEDLKTGLVRIVGRYWQEGSSNRVYLWAQLKNDPGVAGYIPIVVKKPASLGDTHNTANDVKLSPYNLDSFIIYHAGIEGVLPQYLKAMISVETMGFFDPCYRYEVWKDIEKLQVKDRAGKCMYESDVYSHYRILSSTDKGTPDIPTGHSNVRDASVTRQPYPGYKTIWDYYWNHRSFYTLETYPDKERKKKYKDTFDTLSIRLFIKVADSLNITERKVVTDSANKQYYQWLRYDYEGGMEKMIAQTRLYASYGLLQLVYYGGEEYPQNDSDYRPEDINDHSKGFRYGIKHLVNKFNLESILNKCFNDPTWQNGLETNYFKAIKAYNGTGLKAIEHANNVIDQVPTFLPKK